MAEHVSKSRGQRSGGSQKSAYFTALSTVERLVNEWYMKNRPPPPAVAEQNLEPVLELSALELRRQQNMKENGLKIAELLKDSLAQ
jgi:hypothetical protein